MMMLNSCDYLLKVRMYHFDLDLSLLTGCSAVYTASVCIDEDKEEIYEQVAIFIMCLLY